MVSCAHDAIKLKAMNPTDTSTTTAQPSSLEEPKIGHAKTASLDTPLRTSTAHFKAEHFEFESPPEAPVFYPTEEEFLDPLAYINKIRTVAEQTGICKIKPPENWQPPFAVDVDKLRFTPRIQRLNELEAKTRVKLNFLDQIAKFWELQGSSLRIPMVEKRVLDLYTLHRLVQKEGGFEVVSKDRKWSRIASFMGYPSGKGIGTILKTHFERLLYPYDVFSYGKSQNKKISLTENSPESVDKDYKPHGIAGRMNVKPPKDKHFRRSKRYEIENDIKPKVESDENAVKDEKMDTTPDGFRGFGAKIPCPKNGDAKVKNKHFESDPLAKYICQHCSRGDSEEYMLLCDGCDDSYHTFCLMPPLSEIPKGDWRCPKCVAVEVSKPVEAFGFEQAQREYSLQQFGEMADQFKSEYFNMPVHLVPTYLVEKEFWRIVSSIDEDVTVEYGADLHTMDHGSGFPTATSLNLHPGDIEYAYSGWNLNNLPVLEGSVLGYINADISGMKVPWMYVGMCFATFCWHNEDHWSYSINYLHWGEPKTWYGVPGSKAVAFEDTMRSAAPELFHSQPDLLHQLVTIMNPNILMAAGVPVFRTDQNAGEFVVTFPRAYHAGFNQGYNFAEAVNFAPADWLKMGRDCIQHYSILRRFCVFSHDELVCKMALEPEKLNPLIAASTYKDMLHMVDTEKKQRRNLLDWGVTNAEREAFELIPDDERQCEICKTTCFLSAISCKCQEKTLVCLRHYKELCQCPASDHTLRYRYTLDELPKMLQKLKVKAEAFDIWLSKVKDSLDPNVPSTLTYQELKELLNQAEEKKFPKSELLTTLTNALEDAEKCAGVIRQLDSTMARTRTRNSTDRRYHLNLEELTLFLGEIESLACVLEESKVVKELLSESNKFEDNSKQFLSMSLDKCNIEELEKCLEQGESICIELPSLGLMRDRVKQLKWLEEVKKTRNKRERLEMDMIKKLMESGELLPSDSLIEQQIASMKKCLNQGQLWEERAQNLLKKKPYDLMSEINNLLEEAKQIETYLPTEQFLIDGIESVKQWTKCLDEINAQEFYPYIDIIENLIKKGESIPLPISDVVELQKYVLDGYAWKEKTGRTFLRKNCSLSLMEALSPRLFNSSGVKSRRKLTEDLSFNVTSEMEPSDVVNTFKEAEERELEGLRLLRTTNVSKVLKPDSDYKFCICERGAHGVMMRCELCRDWFHSTCVNLPKIANIKTRNNIISTMLRMDFKDCKFLCPNCYRTKRPRLETILNLLVSLQKLYVRIPEGEALQCLTERAMTWQDRVKQLLQKDEFERSMNKLNHWTQKHSESGTRQKIEFKKGTNNSELPHHVPDFASSSNSGVDDLFGVVNSSSPMSLDDDSDCSKVTSSLVEDTIDEHAYSLHVPNSEDYDYTIRLSSQSQQQLEEILMEGDLLEVSLEETFKLWKILLVSRNDKILMDFNESSKTSPLKKNRKRRSDEVGPAKKQQKCTASEKKVVKKKQKVVKATGNRRTKNNKDQQDSSEDDEDEYDKCALSNCLLPSSEEVDWVQCDGGCEKWFHMICVGLSVQEITEDEDYICTSCSQGNSAFGNLQQSPGSQLSDNQPSPDSTQPSSSKEDI